MVSEGAGQGVLTLACLQDLSQARGRWGGAAEGFLSLFGTTVVGGTYGYGTVFELTPGANGTWTEAVLYSFCAGNNCPDGVGPSSSLIFDAAGNLYGTTAYGGASGVGCGGSGCGTVFELQPGSGGTWTESVLYSFCPTNDCTDGSIPFAT